MKRGVVGVDFWCVGVAFVHFGVGFERVGVCKVAVEAVFGGVGFNFGVFGFF